MSHGTEQRYYAAVEADLTETRRLLAVAVEALEFVASDKHGWVECIGAAQFALQHIQTPTAGESPLKDSEISDG